MDTVAQTIAKFELYVDDNSTMSSSETLDLYNKIYQRVLDAYMWTFLQKEYTGTHTAGVVTLPSDFKYFTFNEEEDGEKSIVIYVGSNFEPYKVIPFDRRREYRNVKGYAYLDAFARELKFTVAPDDTAVEFDYIYRPTALDTTDTPILPSNSSVIYHGMAMDFFMIDNTPKNRSYFEEHKKAYGEALDALILENFNLYGANNGII